MKVCVRIIASLPLLLLGTGAFAQKIKITPDRPSGLYQKGESVTWNIQAEGDGLAGVKALYKVKKGGLNAVSEGEVLLSGSPASVTAQSAAPGWLLLEVEAKAENGSTIKALGGAIFSPEEIKPATPAPADFDSFWSRKIAELKQVPPKAQVTPMPSGREGVSYELVTLDNIKGTKIFGQLAKPDKPGKHPALLIVQWAGVYALDKSWAVDRAAEGWLTFNIQAHQLPVSGTPEFFKEQSDGPLRNYPAIGAEDRESSYFLRMYLSCYRAADYLASRPEWNGKVMVVTGGSQGGLQTLVTAAIHPKITGAVASVPAGCDESSLLAERAPGWPMWPWFANGPNAEKIKATAPYFDVVNFASKIKCPLLVGIGGIDTVCPPHGIYAAFNLVKSRKEAVFMPLADHMGDHAAYYTRNWQWMNALKAGDPPPAP